jgi:hypothetical protein
MRKAVKLRENLELQSLSAVSVCEASASTGIGPFRILPQRCEILAELTRPEPSQSGRRTFSAPGPRICFDDHQIPVVAQTAALLLPVGVEDRDGFARLWITVAPPAHPVAGIVSEELERLVEPRSSSSRASDRGSAPPRGSGRHTYLAAPFASWLAPAS